MIEGQARFIQLQFLSFARNTHLSFDEVEEQGYLDDVYGTAFRCFLEFVESEPPCTIHDPLVALFLLICDISLNPTKGFPLEIERPKDFIRDTDCNFRFFSLCMAVRNKCPQLKTYIKHYSKEEYIQASTVLTSCCGMDHPFLALERIQSWAKNDTGIQRLLSEQKTFEYGLENHPIRVLFSHFLVFSLDKYDHPEYFCWAGTHMAEERSGTPSKELWLKHLSLFTDKADDGGIFARLFPGKSVASIKHTLNNFYGTSIVYDLARQWTLQDGPFIYDFSWITEQFSKEVVEEKAKDLFKKLYGANPDEIEMR